MTAAKKLAWIAAGYAFAVVVGFAAVGVNELLIPEDISQTYGGMVAFGDVVLFVLVSGFMGLLPTWFLLKLCFEKAPRAALVTLLVIAALGPPSWLAISDLGSPDGGALPQTGGELLGLLIAFGAMPRIIAGPVLLVIEGLSFLLVRQRVTRALLAAAMLMDVVPLGLFARHMASVTPG